MEVSTMFRFIIAFTLGILFGAQASAYCQNISYPFVEAARTGNLEKVQHMLSANTNVNTHDCADRTALHAAVAAGQVHIVEELLRQDKIDINAVDHWGLSPLALAIFGHRYLIVVWLVEAGAQIDANALKARQSLLKSYTTGSESISIITWGPNKKPEMHEASVILRSPCAEFRADGAFKKKILHTKAVLEYFSILEEANFKTTPEILQQARERINVFFMLERARSNDAKQKCAYLSVDVPRY